MTNYCFLGKQFMCFLKFDLTSIVFKFASALRGIQCVQKVWKHPNKIETNDFREKLKNR
jgi:hypothetical protein